MTQKTALFVDLSKAFDTVDHHLLLKKLGNIGLDSSACDWFNDYISSRRQCLTFGDVQSDFLSVAKGVPQGSVLGPALFTIFINDIISSLHDCQAHLYADDRVLYCIADSTQLAIDNLQLSFNVLQEVLINLKLVLNAGKTKCRLFSRARNASTDNLHLSTLSGSCIEQVTEYKYFGVWLD